LASSQAWTQQVVDSSVFQISFSDVSCATNHVTYDNTTYQLQSLNFHTPSEHSIGGGFYSGEVQFIHQSTTDATDVLVISVFLKQSSYDIPGSHNEFLEVLWESGGNDAEALSTTTTINGSTVVSPYESFTPAKQAQYYYVGSLTTPNCTGDVPYFIFEEPIVVSQADLQLLRNIVSNSTSNRLSADGNNNRPIQPLNNRTITYFAGGIAATSAPTTAPTPEPSHAPTLAPVDQHKHLRRPKPKTALVIGSVALAVSVCMIGVVGVLLYEIIVSYGYDKRIYRFLFEIDDGGGNYKKAPTADNEDEGDNMELVGQSGELIVPVKVIEVEYTRKDGDADDDSIIAGNNNIKSSKFTKNILVTGTKPEIVDVRHRPHLFPENATVDAPSIQLTVRHGDVLSFEKSEDVNVHIGSSNKKTNATNNDDKKFDKKKTLLPSLPQLPLTGPARKTAFAVSAHIDSGATEN
jgi:carbonic anhydrase